jgi:hypothetical protein
LSCKLRHGQESFAACTAIRLYSGVPVTSSRSEVVTRLERLRACGRWQRSPSLAPPLILKGRATEPYRLRSRTRSLSRKSRHSTSLRETSRKSSGRNSTFRARRVKNIFFATDFSRATDRWCFRISAEFAWLRVDVLKKGCSPVRWVTAPRDRPHMRCEPQRASCCREL